MNSVRKAWRWLADEPHQLIGLRVLQVAIGSALLFRVATECRFAPYLYGPHGLAEGTTRYILGPVLGGLFDHAFDSNASTLAVLGVLAAASLCLVLGYRTRLATFLALLTFFLLEQRLPEIVDGGDNVTRLVLMYMLFALASRSRPAPGSLQVWLNNVAMLAIGAQVCIVYEVAGIMKAMGERWQHGTAIYYISQVEWFSHPAFRSMFRHPLVATAGTYLPMILLIFFPMAMLTRLRLPWIACGIMFHVGIAITMGLVTFATVMVGLELFMITDAEYRRLGAALAAARRRAQQGLRYPLPAGRRLRC